MTTSLRTVERLLLSCLDRPDAAAALLPKAVREVALSLRREKWEVSMMVKNGHADGHVARMRLEQLVDDIAGCTMPELQVAKATLIEYLSTQKLTPELHAKLVELHGDDDTGVARRAETELLCPLICARRQDLR